MNADPLPEEYEHKSFWTRLSHRILPTDPDEDEEEGAVAAVHGKGHMPLRLQNTRSSRVAVRRNAQVFDDARLAADGLKSGEHQIVNLESASPQMAERIRDFLSGVTYALDGTVQPVGEKVYMYVPANVMVEIDEGAATRSPRKTPYDDPRE